MRQKTNNRGGTGQLDQAVVALGKRIRALREQLSWTQADLAARAGTSAQAISQFESATRLMRLESLMMIAQALGVEPWKLLAPGEESRGPGVTYSAAARQLDLHLSRSQLEWLASVPPEQMSALLDAVQGVVQAFAEESAKPAKNRRATAS